MQPKGVVSRTSGRDYVKELEKRKQGGGEYTQRVRGLFAAIQGASGPGRIVTIVRETSNPHEVG